MKRDEDTADTDSNIDEDKELEDESLKSFFYIKKETA